MFKVSKYVQDEQLQHWLNDFFQYVDSGRLQRGCALYTSGALVDFQSEEDGFTAEVQGSRRHPYEITGETDFFDLNGLPDVEYLWLACTCPDGVSICKHSVCAIIGWAVELDRQSETQVGTKAKAMTQNQRLPRKSQVTDHPRLQIKMDRRHLNEELDKHRQSLTQQLQNLEQLAKSNPHSILKLGDASFWEFKPRLDKVMKDVHGVVTKSQRRDRK